MAEGRTNPGIAKELWLTEKTVETHVRLILGKLDLPQDGDTHRRPRRRRTSARRSRSALDLGTSTESRPGTGVDVPAARAA